MTKLASLHIGGAVQAGLIQGDTVRLLDPPVLDPAGGKARSDVRDLITASAGDPGGLAKWASPEARSLAGVAFAPPVPDPSFLGVVDRRTYRRDQEEVTRQPATAAFMPVRPVPDSALGGHEGVFLPPSLTRRIEVGAHLACIVGPGSGVFGFTGLIACRETRLADAVSSPFPWSVRDQGIAALWLSRWYDGSHTLGPWIAGAGEFPATVTISLQVEGFQQREAECRCDDAATVLNQFGQLFDPWPGDVIGLLSPLQPVEILSAPREALTISASFGPIGPLRMTLDPTRWLRGAIYSPRYRPSVAAALAERDARRQGG